MSQYSNPPFWKRRRLLLWLLPLGLISAMALGWTLWTEHHPHQERELRLLAQEQLTDWFPEQMSLPDDRLGFIPRSAEALRQGQPRVLLVHGLDEPGGIWDDLVPMLDEAGIEAWEFRYPNDQAIDHSADELAEHWPELDVEQPLVLIGHSMGGLVIRDFVSRWRHPVEQEPQVDGAVVTGVILVATPNHGSGWARLRAWLELREWAADIAEREFSLFAGLRDGTGAAKIDLRPGSQFLNELNDRPWPESVAVRIIGGVLTEPTAAMQDGLEALAATLGSDDALEAVERWWQELGEDLGDGVVAKDSLPLPYAPPPTLVTASHRGLLVRTPLTDDDQQPPAIEPLMAIVHEMLNAAPSPNPLP